MYQTRRPWHQQPMRFTSLGEEQQSVKFKFDVRIARSGTLSHRDIQKRYNRPGGSILAQIPASGPCHGIAASGAEPELLP